MRELHQPDGSGPGDGLAFAFFLGLYDEDSGGADVENTEAELAALQDDIAALCAHGYRVLVDTEADLDGLTSFVYGEDPDLEGASPAGLLWSSHGEQTGQVQTYAGELVSYRQLDPRRVAGTLRSVIFSACHVGRWESYWRQAFGGARVYGWGKPVGFARAAEFYDPTSDASVRLDRILERDLDLEKGSIREIHLGMYADEEEGEGEGPEGPLVAILEEALEHLGVPTSGGIGYDPEVDRFVLDLVFGDGRHQRVGVAFTDAGPGIEPCLGAVQLLMVESLVGPFPEDGLDREADVEVDEVGLYFAAEDVHFARIQIQDDPEEIVVQACLPGDADPALLGLVIDEVGTTADVLEEEIFRVDRS